ncbi:unnamed protein product [Chironomus riparius]|uniref:Uncharacterized protein n=1 Tax=Chironomus riparius TaxID=315576 RepID=A0A9N9S262_9DIPT|nr:unnamed protein product [Chironomus riparius]
MNVLIELNNFVENFSPKLMQYQHLTLIVIMKTIITYYALQNTLYKPSTGKQHYERLSKLFEEISSTNQHFIA